MVKSDKKWRGGAREKQQTFNIINNVDLQNRLVKRNPVSKKKKGGGELRMARRSERGEHGGLVAKAK